MKQLNKCYATWRQLERRIYSYGCRQRETQSFDFIRKQQFCSAKGKESYRKMEDLQALKKSWLEELVVDKDGFLQLGRLGPKDEMILNTSRTSRLIFEDPDADDSKVIGLAQIPIVGPGTITLKPVTLKSFKKSDDLFFPTYLPGDTFYFERVSTMRSAAGKRYAQLPSGKEALQ